MLSILEMKHGDTFAMNAHIPYTHLKTKFCFGAVYK